MSKVIENRMKPRHLRQRIISLITILAALGLTGLLLAAMTPATSHATRSFEIRPDIIKTQAVMPGTPATALVTMSTTTPMPQQYQAIVLYDTFVGVFRDPVGAERAGVTSLKSKTLVYVCDAASDSVTLRYQVSLGPCDTTEPIGWMNSNTISPPIPPWPEARVTSFPVPTPGPQPTWTPTETPMPPQVAVPTSNWGSILQSNKILLVGAILLVLAGLGYLFWKIVSAPSNTEIHISRPPREPMRQPPTPQSGHESRPDLGQADRQSTKLAEVRRLITDRLDIEDLRTLCFDLEVDFDALRGEGKGAKARELVALMARQQRVPELIKEIGRLTQEGASGGTDKDQGDASQAPARPEDSST